MNTTDKSLELYNAFYGGEIDSWKQLTIHNYKGEELKEFIDFVISSVSKSAPQTEDVEALAREIIKANIPSGIVNIKAIGGGNGKPQYKAEIDVIVKCMKEYASKVSAAKKEAAQVPVSQNDLWIEANSLYSKKEHTQDGRDLQMENFVINCKTTGAPVVPVEPNDLVASVRQDSIGCCDAPFDSNNSNHQK
jgi:hypothetical protein